MSDEEIWANPQGLKVIYEKVFTCTHLIGDSYLKTKINEALDKF